MRLMDEERVQVDNIDVSGEQAKMPAPVPRLDEPRPLEQRSIQGVDDIPEPVRKTFKFRRDGVEYSIEYRPLTYDQIEEVRASLLPPKPPTRPIAGLEKMRPKELAQRALAGLPTHEPDEDNPEYRAAMVKYNNDIKLDQLRRALGWDIKAEDFSRRIRSRFLAGELQSLMDEVDSSAWSINSSMVDRFFETLNQSMPTDDDSATSTST